MKIAIPLFKERVSPHFGASSKVLLVEARDATLHQETVLDVRGEDAMKIARHLVDLGVEKLMCGGIQSHYKDWLTRKGVTVVDNQRGMAREIIQKIL